MALNTAKEELLVLLNGDRAIHPDMLFDVMKRIGTDGRIGSIRIDGEHGSFLPFDIYLNTEKKEGKIDTKVFFVNDNVRKQLERTRVMCLRGRNE
jgi:hypothetical protein